MLLQLLILPFLATASPVKRWANQTLQGSAEAANKTYFGTAFQSYYNADPAYSNILNTQFGQFTPENEMKWEVIEPSRGVFNWTGADLVSWLQPVAELIIQIIQTAKKNGAIVRGHNFVWDQQTSVVI